MILSITERGEELHDKAAAIPDEMAACVTLGSEEAMQLYNLLHMMMKTF